MASLLKWLMLMTLALPLITGIVALLLGFGDPWGMGAQDPWGVFVTAALPILPPGLWQVLAWPMTFGVAVLLSPVARWRPGYYIGIVLTYLALVAGAWLVLAWLDPDVVDQWVSGSSYDPGQLDKRSFQFGVYLLADAGVLGAGLTWWYRRRRREPVGPT